MSDIPERPTPAVEHSRATIAELRARLEAMEKEVNELRELRTQTLERYLTNAQKTVKNEKQNTR